MNEARGQLSAPESDRVRLDAPIGRGTRAFLAVLVVCALLVAAFGVSRIWTGRRSTDGVEPGCITKPRTRSMSLRSVL